MAAMEPASGLNKGDYRQRLYERYLSQQVRLDVASIRARLEAGHPYLKRLVRQHFPENKSAKILDLGCGHGSLLYTLKKAGYTDIAGVETSPEQVSAAQQLGLDCVKQGDIVATLNAAPAGSMDVIVAFDVLEHFTKNEVIELLDAIHRVLKPGGRFIIHVPNGEGIFSGKIFFGDFTHQVAFTQKSLRQVLAACGFARVSCFEDTPVAHGLASSIRAALWQLVRLRYRLVNAIETGDSGKSLILSQNLLAVAFKDAAGG
jgi:2-polyprenyl-3-methyl-5-hydroxy-6-metoxy-1,4-benzoquinol methylase